MPKPARRRVGRRGLRVPMGEGTVKGGSPEPHHMAPCFPFTYHVNGGAMVSRLAGDEKDLRFESRSIYDKSLTPAKLFRLGSVSVDEYGSPKVLIFRSYWEREAVEKTEKFRKSQGLAS
ncbi:hypothetical protein OUZ56_016227 [Daphnia magna]|uniref:Uncharacterized protein n=1 Tax=Daphnia magna TaxID=35525 RepID=A0ABR0AQ74_9CRUS|nr:hypothetical protein OUZ56_016227 [Daphnia magna]